MTQHLAPKGHAPFGSMLRGCVVFGLGSAILMTALMGALRGADGALGGLLGSVVALVILLVGLLGIGAIVSGHASLAMAGALVVYLGQLILLAAVVLALRDASWLDGRAFAIGAIVTTLLVQVGLVVGYTRARHVMFPDAGEASR
jgi:hypothetical protein